MTASGLARAAGLDATTFNKSKRKSREGKLRWPNTDSIARVLEATGESVIAFVGLMGNAAATGERRRVQVLAYAEAARGNHFDEAGYPSGRGWDEIEFPGAPDPAMYALRVTGNSLEPAYRQGNVLIMSPAAPIRRGDRVLLRTRKGEVMLKELLRRTARRVELRSLNPSGSDRAVAPDDIRWMARLLWASQ